MSECEIIKVENQECSLTPKIVTFQNGQPCNTNKFNCKSFANSENNWTTVAIASDRLTYVGEVNKNDLFHTLLVLRNKNDNKVRIVPANTVSMNVCMSKINDTLETTLNTTTMNVGDLYKQFGSKKSKRRTEQYEKMKMNISNVEEELKSAVASVTIKEDDLVTNGVEENMADYRPKINREASKVEDVYDLYQIIQKDELNSMKEIARDIIENSVIKEQLSEFALDCINKLKQASVTDIKKYEILLYCDTILKFFKMNTRSINNKTLKIPPYPEKIVNKVIKEYTVYSENSRHRPLSFRDKAVCYVIVLALIAMNYKLDLEPLGKSINVSLKRLCEISRVLGAQPLSSTCKTSIILKLPLPPPITGNMRRGKKKM